MRLLLSRNFSVAWLFILHLFTFPAMAEVPSLSELRPRWYAIRFSPGIGLDEQLFYAESGAGLWSWNPANSVWTRVHPLVYGAGGNGSRAGIAAKEDTIVVQGTTFLEFDAMTNRLLRRYAALPTELQEWGFRGEYLTERQANIAGLKSGYYGFAYCPEAVGVAGQQCGPSVFPGNSSATDATMGNLFYYRDPATPTLTLLKVLPLGPGGIAGQESRTLGFDPTRSRFWSMHRFPPPSGSGFGRYEFGFFPVANGIVQEAVVLETEDPAIFHSGGGGTLYDALNDTLLSLRWFNGISLLARPADLSGPEQAVEMNEGSRPPVAMARLASELPTVYEQVVPVIGNGPGAQGTYWRSDLWLFNPSPEATTVKLRRVAKPGVTRDIALAPYASVAFDDVLKTLGGGPIDIGGDGTVTDGLVLTAPYRWGAQVTAHSRNYTPAADGHGTYGQAIPAVPTKLGYSTHVSDGQAALDVYGEAPEFFLDLRERNQFRHNIGVVNDDSEALVLDLYYGRVAGEITQRWSIPAHTVANINLEAAIASELLTNEPSIVRIAASRPAPVWLSMIDNKTGDATFLPYALFGLLGALDATMAVPQIARTPGANGTFWRSDLYGYFHAPVTHEQLPRVHFYPADPAQCGGMNRLDGVLTGPIGQPGNPTMSSAPSLYRRIFPDAAGQLTDCPTGAMGALELNVGSWMAGFTRTYTTRADGGTYGDILPFYPTGGWPVQHFSGLTINAAYRINLGLYNGKDYAVVHQILVYDAAGNEVRNRELTVAPRRSVQASLASFVGELPSGLYSMTVLPLNKDTELGRSWAYVAIVDNATGDTTNLW